MRSCLVTWLLLLALAISGGLAGCSVAPMPTVGAPTSPPIHAPAAQSAAAGDGGSATVSTAATFSNFHVEGAWGTPYYHGAMVVAAGYDYTRALVGPLPCSACHAGDSRSQPSPNTRAPSCFACHEGGPDGSALHPPGWLDATDRDYHGSRVAAAGYDYTRALAGTMACSACHAGDTPGDASPNSRAPNCFACHAGGPDGSAAHPAGWLDMTSPDFHGGVAGAFFLGDGVVNKLACAACHAGVSPAQASPNTRAPNCFSCHGGGPDGSPGHPAGWVDPASANFHGAVVEAAGFDFTRAKASGLTCNTCHAGLKPTQASPVARAPNCFFCHAGGPDGSPGHPAWWLDPTSSGNHGQIVLSAGGDFTRAKSGHLTCNVCHAGTSPTQVSPVEEAPNCFSCHPGGPPWLPPP